MRYSKALFPLLLLLFGSAYSQISPSATPTPTPRPGSRQAVANPLLNDKDSYERLRSIESIGQSAEREPPPLLVGKESIYRKPSRSETAALAVSDQLLLKYAEFLRSKGNGIVKLSSDSSCVSASDVVVASEQCLPFMFPGAGTAFSFRTESYRLPRLADVILINNEIMTGGVFQQVIAVDIGDVDLNGLTPASATLSYLFSAKPAKDSDEFKQFDTQLIAGIDENGLLHRKNQPVKLNTTFAIRSIAYRGKSIRTLDGFLYNELEYDKRRDVIVVFRIVEKDANGNITLLWKKLRDVEAPVLKVMKQPESK